MIFAAAALSFVIAVIVSLLVVRQWRRRWERNQESDPVARKLRTEINDLITDLNGTAERNIALLESRVQALNQLIEKAEKTCAVLGKERDKIENTERVYRELGRNRPLDLMVENEAPQTDGAMPPDMVDYDSLPIRDKALFLHRQGDQPERIAAALGMSRGEVELVISLHGRRF